MKEKYLYLHMRILLVDDDEDDQDVFKEAASIVVPDIECVVAKDGVDGLAKLETLTPKPDFIFLDVNMPKMDGREFLRHVKEHATFKNIFVIIYSISSHKSELGEYFKLGAISFITKPSEFNLLITYLRSVLA